MGEMRQAFTDSHDKLAQLSILNPMPTTKHGGMHAKHRAGTKT